MIRRWLVYYADGSERIVLASDYVAIVARAIQAHPDSTVIGYVRQP